MDANVWVPLWRTKLAAMFQWQAGFSPAKECPGRLDRSGKRMDNIIAGG